MANTRKRKNVSSIDTDKLPDVKRINRNAREQERMMSFKNTFQDLGKFLVEKEICTNDQVTSKQKILDQTFSYIKEMNTISNDDILDLSNIFDDIYNNYNEMNKMTFCFSQVEAVDIVKNITRIWDEQTGFSMNPKFYQYIDGNSMNDEISNLLLIDYRDIFDLLDYVIDWDRFLTYEQVSFVRANAHNFKRLMNNDNVEYIIWELVGSIYERCVYKN